MLPLPTPDRLTRLRNALAHGLVDRDVPARVLLLTALAGEHALLLGPPGTGKSLLARRLSNIFRDGQWFERLLTRFSVPEELFGPLSIRALEQDRYVRKTERYLPTATVAFLDEIFKANSAILNALLTILNERAFDDDGQRHSIPLATLVGASNELPEGDELAALYDRFLVRLHVTPVSDADFVSLLRDANARVPAIEDADRLQPEEVAAIEAAAETVGVPDAVVQLLAELRGYLREGGLFVSDRRWLRIVRLLRISAVTDGRREVSPWDVWLVQHCLWHTPDHREVVFDWYARRVAGWGVRQPERLVRLVAKWEARVGQLEAQKAQQRDPAGRLLYQRPDGRAHTSARWAPKGAQTRYRIESGWRREYHAVDEMNDGNGWSREELDALRIPDGTHFSRWSRRDAWLADPKNMLVHELPPLLGPMRHSRAAVEDLDRQVATIAKELDEHRAWLEAQQREARGAIERHPWVPDAFASVASKGLDEQHASVRALEARIREVRARIGRLPLEVEPIEVEPVEADQADATAGVSA